jgi:drug/metabolite transporter (DMT)-like permease
LAHPPRPLDYLLLGLLSVVWGSSFLLIKLAVGSLPPLSITAGRLCLGAIALLTVAWLGGGRLPRGLAAWRYIALFGLIGMVIPFALISWGETRIDSGLTAILMAIIPLVTVLLAHFLQRDEPLSGGRLVGVALGLVGVLVLVGPAALAHLGADLAGQLAVCGATITYALAGNFGRRIPPMPADVTGGAALLCATLITVPAALLVDRPWQLAPTGLALAALAILGLIGTAGGYILFFRLLARCGAGFASSCNFLIPLVGVAWGVLLLGEQPSPNALAALALILVGLAMPRLWPGRRATAGH